MRIKPVLAIGREVIGNWSDANGARLAAALAYYTLLSIAPLLVIAVAVLGLIFGEEAARGQVVAEFGGIVGGQASDAIETIAEHAKQPTGGVLSSIIGVVVLLFGASAVFGELQTALNTIWQVEPRPGRGFVGIVKDRFFSFTLVAGVAFLLLVSMLASAALSAVGAYFANTLPGGKTLWTILNQLISLQMITWLFVIVFKVVPDVELHWRAVWTGAFLTALLFSVGKALMGLYLGKSTLTSSYGAAGSLVALVVWVYYSSQLVFLGASLTRVLAVRSGRPPKPSDDAVPIEEPTPHEASAS